MAYYHTKNTVKDVENPYQLNKINGISPKNHDYDGLREGLIKFVENEIEEEYLMMQEILLTPWY